MNFSQLVRFLEEKVAEDIDNAAKQKEIIDNKILKNNKRLKLIHLCRFIPTLLTLTVCLSLLSLGIYIGYESFLASKFNELVSGFYFFISACLSGSSSYAIYKTLVNNRDFEDFAYKYIVNPLCNRNEKKIEIYKKKSKKLSFSINNKRIIQSKIPFAYNYYNFLVEQEAKKYKISTKEVQLFYELVGKYDIGSLVLILYSGKIMEFNQKNYDGKLKIIEMLQAKSRLKVEMEKTKKVLTDRKNLILQKQMEEFNDHALKTNFQNNVVEDNNNIFYNDDVVPRKK